MLVTSLTFSVWFILPAAPAKIKAKIILRAIYVSFVEQAAAKRPVEQQVRSEPPVELASPVESLRDTLESATKTLAEQKKLLLDQNSSMQALTTSTATERCFVC